MTLKTKYVLINAINKSGIQLSMVYALNVKHKTVSIVQLIKTFVLNVYLNLLLMLKINVIPVHNSVTIVLIHYNVTSV
jgi:hypothetical protein